MTPARLAELDALFESRAGTEAGNAGAELIAEVRRLHQLIGNVTSDLATTVELLNELRVIALGSTDVRVVGPLAVAAALY